MSAFVKVSSIVVNMTFKHLYFFINETNNEGYADGDIILHMHHQGPRFKDLTSDSNPLSFIS
jgi:hypothetical protein